MRLEHTRLSLLNYLAFSTLESLCTSFTLRPRMVSLAIGDGPEVRGGKGQDLVGRRTKAYMSRRTWQYLMCMLFLPLIAWTSTKMYMTGDHRRTRPSSRSRLQDALRRPPRLLPILRPGQLCLPGVETALSSLIACLPPSLPSDDSLLRGPREITPQIRPGWMF
jgi:hypothetical protein